MIHHDECNTNDECHDGDTDATLQKRGRFLSFYTGNLIMIPKTLACVPQLRWTGIFWHSVFIRMTY